MEIHPRLQVEGLLILQEVGDYSFGRFLFVWDFDFLAIKRVYFLEMPADLADEFLQAGES